jgi:hypothetical protein
MNGLYPVLCPHPEERGHGGIHPSYFPISTLGFPPRDGGNKERTGKDVLRVSKGYLVREVFCPSLKKGKKDVFW